MKNKELLEKLKELAKEAGYTIDWVSPEWEPITKVSEQNRLVFMFILGRCLASIMEEESELGVATVKWTGCHPDREFLAGAKEEINKYIEEANG